MKLSIFLAIATTCMVGSAKDSFPIAENLPPTGLNRSFSAGAGLAGDNDKVYDNRIGQSFSPTQTGHLIEASWIIDFSPDSKFSPLKVAVHTVENGFPGRIISTAYIDQSAIPTGEERREKLLAYDFTATAVFSDPPLLFGWRNYCFVLSSNEPNANYRITGTYENKGGYEFGMAYDFTRQKEFVDEPDKDYFFQAVATTVDPLPFLTGVLVIVFSLGFVAGYTSFRSRGRSNKCMESKS